MKNDLTNRVFGQLKALYVDREKSASNVIYWKCLCQRCQKEVSIQYSNLLFGNSKHCQSCGSIKLTEDEDEVVRKLYSKGMSKKDIQEKMKAGRNAVNSSLVRTAQKNNNKEEER